MDNKAETTDESKKWYKVTRKEDGRWNSPVEVESPSPTQEGVEEYFQGRPRWGEGGEREKYGIYPYEMPPPPPAQVETVRALVHDWAVNFSMEPMRHRVGADYAKSFGPKWRLPTSGELLYLVHELKGKESHPHAPTAALASKLAKTRNYFLTSDKGAWDGTMFVNVIDARPVWKYDQIEGIALPCKEC